MRPHPPLRLTRRGKAVLWGLSLLLVVLVAGQVAPATQVTPQHAQAAGLRPPTGASAARAVPPGAVPRSGEQVVVVRPGDTLWSIAAAHAPSLDPYGIIEEIRRRNDLPDHTIHAGQELILP
jgi:LysM repeat protein